MRGWTLLGLVALIGLNGATSFTTKQQGPAFKGVNSKKDEADVFQPAASHTSCASNTAAFGVDTAAAQAAAVAYGPYYYAEQESDDEDLVGFGTAVISCLLSLALGFGLGYGT